MLKTTTKFVVLFATYAFEPSGDKAMLVGREPTNTVLAANVFVLIIAIEFCDGIVAYIIGWVGLMANDDAGKLYSATTSPKAAWTLFAMSEPLSHNTKPRNSRVGKESICCVLVLITLPWYCGSGLIGEKESRM